MNPGTLLFRADADPAIGTGHVMRCLALAQGWQDAGGVAVLAAAEIPVGLEKRLADEKVELVQLQSNAGTAADATELASLAQARAARWVVLDGDRFHPEYFEIVKKQRLKVLWLDDFGSSEVHAADLIVNQNVGATGDCYPWCGDDTRLLLGTKYVTLRREFRRIKPRVEASGTGCNLLVTFGGSDPDNLTEKVLRAVGAESSGVKVTAVVGSGNPRLAALQELARSLHVTLLADVANMPDLMMGSDLAVIVAGGSLWELLYCGCAVLSYSRNSVQAEVIATLAEGEAISDLGPVSAFNGPELCAGIRRVSGSATERERMRMAGMRLVDGDGVLRVLRALRGE